MIQVAYTNSNCADVWQMFCQQTRKHCGLPLYVITDQIIPFQSVDKYHFYGNDVPYYLVWTGALRGFNEDYFIYLQEDFILYKDVDQKKLDYCLQFLKDHPEYSFIRLIKSGSLGSNKIADNLYEIESSNQDIFSMQATIWRTEDYSKLLNEVKAEKWLENDKYGEATIKLGIKGLYYYEDEPKRGINHYDSNVYPYIATALVRGKWNLGEYQAELLPLLNEYKIEITKRGIYK
jgi:hypothetical protein